MKKIGCLGSFWSAFRRRSSALPHKPYRFHLQKSNIEYLRRCVVWIPTVFGGKADTGSGRSAPPTLTRQTFIKRLAGEANDARHRPLFAFIGRGIGGKLRLQAEGFRVRCPSPRGQYSFWKAVSSSFVLGLFPTGFWRMRFIAAAGLLPDEQAPANIAAQSRDGRSFS